MFLSLCALDAAYINATDAQYSPALLPFYHQLKKVPDLLTQSLAVDKVTIYFPNKDSRKIPNVISAQYLARIIPFKSAVRLG
ncbi:hypothetical protein BN194_00290 [Lacticaseibacillus paracasei]|nr:hypothetical protein BN194_00290 [Lacticaseibacillus paracasei]